MKSNKDKDIEDKQKNTTTLLVGSNTEQNNTKPAIINPPVSTLFKHGNTQQLSKRFADVENLSTAIRAYFDKCDEDKKPYTTVGLCLALGFQSRTSLLNYSREEGYEEFFEIMHYAKMKIEEQMEIHLMTKQNVAGVIFLAKNNYGYKDSTEMELKSKNEFITQLIPKAAGGNNNES
jgi:hypothetical protein